MKNNGLLTAIKQVFKDDPTLTIHYDVKTAYYDKAEDETSAANAAFAGERKISLRRLVAGTVILASAAVLLRLSQACQKRNK